MKIIPRGSFASISGRSTLSLALTVFAATQPAVADDSACKAVVSAIRHQLATPYHARTTFALTPGAKPTQSEQISTGKVLYILTNGRWSVSTMTLQALRDQEEENIKNNKMTCRAVRDETVDGVGATVYEVQEDEDTKSQVWLSKASGLIVMSKIAGGETHFVYTDVVAPVTAN